MQEAVKKALAQDQHMLKGKIVNVAKSKPPKGAKPVTEEAPKPRTDADGFAVPSAIKTKQADTPKYVN